MAKHNGSIMIFIVSRSHSLYLLSFIHSLKVIKVFFFVFLLFQFNGFHSSHNYFINFLPIKRQRNSPCPLHTPDFEYFVVDFCVHVSRMAPSSSSSSKAFHKRGTLECLIDSILCLYSKNEARKVISVSLRNVHMLSDGAVLKLLKMTIILKHQ